MTTILLLLGHGSVTVKFDPRLQRLDRKVFSLIIIIFHSFRLACILLVCIQKGIFKFKKIIKINTLTCKYEIKINPEDPDVNYGLIIITDILPFIVLLFILFYTYTVFGILLYYLNIYSKMRWKKLTKKLKEIDTIVGMSLNLIERNAPPKQNVGNENDDCNLVECDGEQGKTCAVDMGNKIKESKADDESQKKTNRSESVMRTDEASDKTKIDNNKRIAESNNGYECQNKQGSDSLDNRVPYENGRKITLRDDSMDTMYCLDFNTQDFTKSTDSMDLLRTSSMCEPLNLYKDEHSQSMKVQLKQHKVIVNVSEENDRIIIQTISEKIQNNSNFNLAEPGCSNVELGGNAFANIIEETNLSNEDIILVKEKEEELNIQFILMLFAMTLMFLLLWLPREIYTYKEFLEEKDVNSNETLGDVYGLTVMNVYNLMKSLNVIILFVLFYCMYNTFRVTFNASFDILCFKKDS